MRTQEFKTNLKKVANQLKGLTIQLITDKSTTPFKSLREFGFAVLNEEQAGNTLSVTKVWTNEGTVEVKGFDQLTQLLTSAKVTAVTFLSYYQPKTHAEYLRTSFGTND